MEQGRPDGREREYLIEFSARRVLWLPRWAPFNRVTIQMLKHTTWAEAQYFADRCANTGAWNVSVTFARE